MITLAPGTMVPFQFGLESVKAEVIGLCCNEEQYLLKFIYEAPDENTGQYVLTERLVQRDRDFIEQLRRYDIQQTLKGLRSLGD